MPNSNNHTTLSDHPKDPLSDSEMSNINLRSEAVQDILGRPPQWMIRWGISMIFVIVLGLFCFFYSKFVFPKCMISQIC